MSIKSIKLPSCFRRGAQRAGWLVSIVFIIASQSFASNELKTAKTKLKKSKDYNKLIKMKNNSKITTGTLIKDMVDMWKLVETPDPFYKTIQFSSYDRASNLPGGKDGLIMLTGLGARKFLIMKRFSKKPTQMESGNILFVIWKGLALW